MFPFITVHDETTHQNLKAETLNQKIIQLLPLHFQVFAKNLLCIRNRLSLDQRPMDSQILGLAISLPSFEAFNFSKPIASCVNVRRCSDSPAVDAQTLSISTHQPSQAQRPFFCLLLWLARLHKLLQSVVSKIETFLFRKIRQPCFAKFWQKLSRVHSKQRNLSTGTKQ